MRKANVITALALTVVMLAAMTGIAAADPESVRPEPEVYDYNIPNDGTPITIDLRIGDFIDGWTPGQTHTIYASTSWAGYGGTVNDLEFRFVNETGIEDSGWIASGTSFPWTDNSNPDYVTFYVRTDPTLSIPVDAKYSIFIMDRWTASGVGVDIGACTVSATAIPEFATIAIPVAAILGLVLFFNHRKHKKE